MSHQQYNTYSSLIVTVRSCVVIAVYGIGIGKTTSRATNHVSTYLYPRIEKTGRGWLEIGSLTSSVTQPPPRRYTVPGRAILYSTHRQHTVLSTVLRATALPYCMIVPRIYANNGYRLRS